MYHVNPASVGNFVWHDANHNGTQDPGEQGIGGITVNLTGTDQFGDSVFATTDTDADGYYSFTDLVPGEYQVEFVRPTGYAYSPQNQGSDDTTDSDADSLTGKTATFTLAAGEFNDTIDAGLVQPTPVIDVVKYVSVDGGNVWNDANDLTGPVLLATGAAPQFQFVVTNLGNVPLSDVVLDDSTFDLNGAEPGTAIAIGSLAPGETYVFTYTGTWSAGQHTNVATVTGSFTDANNHTYTPSDTDPANYYGATPAVSIVKQVSADGGTTWHDADHPQGPSADAGSTLHFRVKVTNTGNVTLTNLSISDQVKLGNGSALNFTGVVLTLAPNASDYSDVISTIAVGGQHTNTATVTGSFTDDAGNIATPTDNNDANYYGLTAAIGNFVWEDINGNGMQDLGEPGISGATVKLFDNNGNQVDSSYTTLSDGFYEFTDLNPGNYSVQFILPAEYVFTAQGQGSDDAKDSDASPASGMTVSYTLVGGQYNDTVDAGAYLPAALGDYVWHDGNANGIQDPGEPVIPGVTVNLKNAVGTVIDTTHTDADGKYSFTQLPPGQYQVAFTNLPTDFYFALQDQGDDDARDSDADAITGMTVPITLRSGEQNLTIDAGLVSIKIDLEKLVKIVRQTPGGGEGLTPGFWKTHSSYGPAPLKGWPETVKNATQSFSPDDLYQSVFGVDVPGIGAEFTLLDALNAGGGGINALLRHSTAALLNAANSNVDYEFSLGEVITDTRAAILSGNASLIESTKNEFAQQNELGADLNTPASGGVFETEPEDADEPSGPPARIGDQVAFIYEVVNLGDVALTNVQVTDDPLGAVVTMIDQGNGDNVLDPGEKWVYTITINATATGVFRNDATVTAIANSTGQSVTDTDPAHYHVATLPAAINVEKYVREFDEQAVSGEGFTPGFWKQSHHFQHWTTFTTNQQFNALFGLTAQQEDRDLTLLGALQRGGGGHRAFARHAAAALLNASQPNVAYAFTIDQVKAMVQQAYTTGDFNTAKNNLESENMLGGDITSGGKGGSALLGFGDDADVGPGPSIPLGGKAIFTYAVSNTGLVSLFGVQVADSTGIVPQPVLNGEFNAGDSNQNGLLEPDEVWLYQAMEQVLSEGLHTNIATALATVLASDPVLTVQDTDAANYTGVPAGDQFGSARLVGFLGEGKATVGIQPTQVFDSSIEVSNLSLSGKKLSLDLTNTSDSGFAILERLMLNWASGNKELAAIRINGNIIFDSKTKWSSVGIEITNWKGSELLRYIGAGQTVKLELEFKVNASTNLGLYDLQFGFGNRLPG